MRTNAYRNIQLLSIVGILLASYLMYEYFAPLDHFSPCTINSYINCNASTKGELAKTLGIPTALYGLFGYAAILLAAFKKWKRVIFGVATFGLLFCLRITVIELFIIHEICPVCVACQIIMLTIFGISFRLVMPQRSKKGVNVKPSS
ncbi:MAG TPA: vitamin K epoxide reductase family protein [Patescibacteria group bacterium]|nr:vitamin K epoxide reductase family protein [Patescibacteria group bacterium]